MSTSYSRDQPHGAGELGHVERKVGVGVQHEVTGGGGEPGLHRPAELAVLGVVHHTDPGVGGRHPVGDDAGVVGRRVVDDDQLVVADLAVLDQNLARPSPEPERALDVRLLVPHRVEDRQLLERRHAIRLRRRELVGAGHAVGG